MRTEWNEILNLGANVATFHWCTESGGNYFGASDLV